MLRSPNRCSRLQVALFGGAIATTATLSFFSPIGSRGVHAELKSSPKALVDEVWQIVNRRFVDGNFNQVDWQATRQRLLSREYASREQAYTAIREALKPLGDRYTRFLDPKQYQELNEQSISGELTGIGIQMAIDKATQQLTVVSAIENSPARAAGLRAGDWIMAIDGQPTQGLTVENASKLIRGQKGTLVTLQIRRQAQRDFSVKLTRATIELPYVTYTLQQAGDRRIGYIRLAEFSSTAPKQMRQAIQALTAQNADGFVLDLRENPGGLLLASVEIARLWLDRGLIVREVERVDGSTDFGANRTALTQKPLVVLVDGESASASEILAGALKDNRRAVIVGSKTFGKALVQQLYPLSDGSGLTVTVGRYLTPSGTDINQKGILPDVAVNLTSTQKQQLAANPELVGTLSDPQYARAIAVLVGNSLNASSTGLQDGKR